MPADPDYLVYKPSTINNLPRGDRYGGVLTSAVGFGDILIERLKKAGIEFSN